MYQPPNDSKKTLAKLLFFGITGLILAPQLWVTSSDPPPHPATTAKPSPAKHYVVPSPVSPDALLGVWVPDALTITRLKKMAVYRRAQLGLPRLLLQKEGFVLNNLPVERLVDDLPVVATDQAGVWYVSHESSGERLRLCYEGGEVTASVMAEGDSYALQIKLFGWGSEEELTLVRIPARLAW